MPREIRVLSVGTSQPFVQKDVQVLRKHFDVRHLEVEYERNIEVLIKDAKAFSQMIAGILWADVVYLWFANLHAYLGVRMAQIVGKPTVVTLGGFEVARVPEFGYGALLDSTQTQRVKYVLNHADVVLAVDDGLKRDAKRNLGISGEKIRTVPTGYDPNRFAPGNSERQSVLTVAAESKWNRARLKGLDTFVTAAAEFDDVAFTVVGVSDTAFERLSAIAPSNVTLVKPVPQDELISWYQRARVYCQLSFREGLPNSLCEAMLCECTPVGTDVQGIRTAIGDTGFLVPFGDVEATATAVEKALSADDRASMARERIANRFPLERRERELTSVIRTCA